MGRNPSKLRRAFGAALRHVRHARGLTQEDFSQSSSRTYVSTLERGEKSPTLDKLEMLADTLGIHPLTLLVLAYSQSAQSDSLDSLMARIHREARELRAVKPR